MEMQGLLEEEIEAEGLLFFFFNFFFFFAVMGRSSLLLVAESGAYSSCTVWASHYRGLSCCGGRALGHAGFSSCGTCG